MPVTDTRTLPINELVLIPELSPRNGLCEETVIRYMDSFSSLPPVRVQGGTGVVVDGYHRVEAAIRLGLEKVRVAEEPIDDAELRLIAGLANIAHGQPLSRPERNRLAVALVSSYGKLREEAAQLLGMSASAVTLALREHQYNELLSEKLGSQIQVINSNHVRALYRVGPEQRERLLEAVVTKVDEDGQPYPLTGAELKLLVDRMLDPATPTAELNRLLNDPKARPKPNGGPGANGANGHHPLVAEGTIVPESADGARPWEREWDSPLKGGDSEAFDRVRSVDEEVGGRGESAGAERQVAELLRRAEANALEEGRYAGNGYGEDEEALEGENRLRAGLAAATRALEEVTPQVQPEAVRRQVEAVVALLRSLG